MMIVIFLITIIITTGRKLRCFIAISSSRCKPAGHSAGFSMLAAMYESMAMVPRCRGMAV
jgi:membrane-associated PAP2 superfamily phosphatase